MPKYPKKRNEKIIESLDRWSRRHKQDYLPFNILNCREYSQSTNIVNSIKNSIKNNKYTNFCNEFIYLIEIIYDYKDDGLFIESVLWKCQKSKTLIIGDFSLKHIPRSSGKHYFVTRKRYNIEEGYKLWEEKCLGKNKMGQIDNLEEFILNIYTNKHLKIYFKIMKDEIDITFG